MLYSVGSKDLIGREEIIKKISYPLLAQEGLAGSLCANECGQRRLLKQERDLNGLCPLLVNLDSGSHTGLRGCLQASRKNSAG